MTYIASNNPEIVEVRGQLLSFRIDMRPAKRFMNAFLDRFAKARARALDVAGKAGVQTLRVLTPQKYSRALSQNWNFSVSGDLRSQTLKFWNRVLNLRRGNGKITGQALLEILASGTRRHEIRASQGKSLFIRASQHSRGLEYFAKSVTHPGTKPNPFMRRALREAESALRLALASEIRKL